MKKPDLSNLKRDAEGNILRSELLRINKNSLRTVLWPSQRRTIIRWLRGKQYWNDWAQNMLIKKKELQEMGKWDVIVSNNGMLIGNNKETALWLDRAECNFQGIEISTIYSCYDSYISNNIVNIVSDFVDFSNMLFPGACKFRGVIFNDATTFFDCRFYGGVYFENSKFRYDANFSKINSKDILSFLNAEFMGNSHFDDANFAGDAYFQGVEFKGSVSFVNSKFHKEADLSAMRSEKTFNLRDAKFHIIPNFIDATFKILPVLDHVKIDNQLRSKRRVLCFQFNSLPDVSMELSRDISRRFRILGRRAHETRDWLHEMEFFAQEIRTRRFGLDFPLGEWRGLRNGAVWLARKWQLKPLRTIALRLARWIKANPYCGPRAGRFWFGWFYEVLSDFGRSFARPFCSWLVSVFGFAALYWWCWARPAASFGDVLAVSFRQGLVISGLVRSGHYQHLLTEVFGPVEGNQSIPNLPHWLFFWMNVQTVLSAFFLFLFFLAVRNHFRIR